MTTAFPGFVKVSVVLTIQLKQRKDNLLKTRKWRERRAEKNRIRRYYLFRSIYVYLIFDSIRA